MNYYVLNQDKEASSIRTAFGSVEEKYLVSIIPVEGVVPVYLKHTDDPLFEDANDGTPIYGDIITGTFSLYSDRVCEVLKSKGVDAVYRPVKIINKLEEDPKEITGYNMVLRIPDGDCIDEESDFETGFSIDETEVDGLKIFDHSLEYGAVRIINEEIKEALVSMGIRGVYIIPTTEYSDSQHRHLLMY